VIADERSVPLQSLIVMIEQAQWDAVLCRLIRPELVPLAEARVERLSQLVLDRRAEIRAHALARRAA